MRIFLVLLIPPLLIFGFALFALWLPLPAPFPPSLSSGRNLPVAVLTGILGLVYIVVLVMILFQAINETSQALDPYLPTGLTSERYMLVGQKYQGLLDGRQVEITYIPSARLQPAQLNVTLSTSLEVEAAIGESRPLLGCRDCPQVEVTAPGLSHLQAYAREVSWAPNLLGNPSAQEILARLLADQKEKGFREVYFQPGKLWLRAHPSRQASGEDIRQWLEDLLALAALAESQ